MIQFYEKTVRIVATYKTMEFFKKTTIGIFSALILSAFAIYGIAHLERQQSTRAVTITQDISINIQSRPAAYQPMLIAPYKTMDVFLSEEQNPGFEFTSVGGSWEEIKPDGTNVEAEVKFKVDGKWSNWIELEEEEDIIQDGVKTEGATRKYTMASSNQATAIQYRYIMYGDGVKSPTVNSPEWTFIKTSQTFTLSAPPAPQFSAGGTTMGASNLNMGGASIVSRDGWGADESYRYVENNNSETQSISFDAEYLATYKDELKFSKVVTAGTGGKDYKWPLQYPETVKKFIIHHTATTSNMDNPKQAIRDIYYYHSITRGWGDIGYNYIVDREGKVYEGRAGGEGVIGAHSGPGNNGSIGIAVLGNYQETELPQKVLNALGELIAAKSKIHNIDPEAKGSFRGEIMPNIFGHKDIMSTTCPGAFLYEKIPVIRKLAAEEKLIVQKQKFVKDYDYIDHSETYFLELQPNETKEITFKVENIGKLDWNSSTYIVVDKNPAFEGIISFPDNAAPVKAKMQEGGVKSGGFGTFKLKVKGGTKTETVYIKASPVMNGSVKSLEYITVPIATQQANFKYQYVDSKPLPDAMDKGETFEAWVKLKNTGNVTWKKSGQNTVLLGTDHERDRISKIVSPASSRIGSLKEESVAPGETGTFIVKVKAPETPGYYKEYFTPVVEGVTWLSDSGMYFETTVFGDSYQGELLEVGSNTEWKQGGKYLIRITVRNIGTTAWTKKNMEVVLLKESDLKVTDAQLLSEPIESGQVGIITMVAEVAPGETLERKSLLVRPKVNGNQILDRPIYVRYKVVQGSTTTTKTASATTTATTTTTAVSANTDKLTSTSTISAPTTSVGTTTAATTANKGSDIRVKLGFSGTPEITANGAFDVYSGSTLLASMNSGEIVTTSYASGLYKVSANGKTFSKSSPIRFGPKNGAIMEIANYEHRPTWNTSLNDNKYRGKFEVRYVDGALVVINELPLEDYLKGLAEISNSELTEKMKAVIIAARTYAIYYMTIDEKFPGKPYNLDDNPDTSQKYLGYGFESRAPKVAAAVDATAGEVVTYSGKVVKTPYFNQSDGTYTKSAKDVWGWTTTPYLVSVNDSYCKGTAFLGHGVGMSGCGAKGMAEAGKTYKEILKHYYTGVSITDLY